MKQVPERERELPNGQMQELSGVTHEAQHLQYIGQSTIIKKDFPMANFLKPERKKMVLDLLVEGNTIRGTQRITGVNRRTIIRIIREVGERCQAKLDSQMRDITSERIQCDEIWTYVQCKQRRLKAHEKGGERGDQYVFVAIDADTKLVPCYYVGKRTEESAWTFMDDLQERVVSKFQMTTDSFNGYNDLDTQRFRRRIAYAQLIKVFSNSKGEKREAYSPSSYVRMIPSVICGNPDPKHISTSYIERQNLTMRTQMRRFTRLTNALSKRLDCLKGALAIHFWHYNFMRTHRTLRMTPAMAAGISSTFGSRDDVLG